MKQGHYPKYRIAMRLLSAVLIGLLLPGGAAWGVVIITPPDLVPLSQIAVPIPTNELQFIKDRAAAARLGKALFWDMQVGSDGVTACATCHFHAGTDTRRRNTVNPGPGNIWEAVIGPDAVLSLTTDTAVFPFHQRTNPDTQSGILRDFHDIVGSQGVRKANFVSITPGSAVDNMTPVADPLFNIGGGAAGNVRQVTGRNVPSQINANFNFNNFWDGRANFIFNGENPFGLADANAGIWMNNPAGTTLVKQPVAIDFAAMASQAVGPVLNDVEMSAAGRTFPEVGRKLLSLVPLGKQYVDPGDGALGAISRAAATPGAKGLTVTYSQMIQAAFQNNLWNSPQTVTLSTVGGAQAFSHMEANFSLFWGLAVQSYVATLVSDQTPFDRFLGGENLALTDQEKLGLAIFQGIGNCVACHGFTEMTNVSQTSIDFVTNNLNFVVDLMFVADGRQVIYDNGFFNTSVTPISDDIGRGGNAPFTNSLTGQPIPLGLVKLAELQALGQLPFSTPILDVFIPPDFPINVDGSFKAPGLRNVELTAPYFHNGSAGTLEEVVEFYVRGGNFPIVNIAELDPVIMGGIPFLQNNPTMKAALVAFLKSLTDPRVAAEAAPFDHPELFIPEGDTAAAEVLTRIAARDAAGNAAVEPGLTLNAVISPTNTATQTITGTVQAGMTIPTVQVNAGVPSSVTQTGTNWSASISGLTQGSNTVTVRATETATSTQSVIAATIILDSAPPAITINPVTSPTGIATQAITGGVEAGATVSVSVNGGAAAPATVTGTSWSYSATLTRGISNTISATATDAAGNTSAPVTATIAVDTTVPPTALNDAAVTTAGTARVINVIANDTGASGAIAPNTIVASAPNQAGSTAAANADGTVTYTPAAGFTGIDFFAYTVADTLGAVSNPAIVTVSVNAAAPAPGPAPGPVAETVTILRAQFRTAGATGEWQVNGTGSVPGSTISIYVGNSLNGAIINATPPVTITVAADGRWQYRQAGSTVQPDATNTISVQTSGGASRLAFPVAVR